MWLADSVQPKATCWKPIWYLIKTRNKLFFVCFFSFCCGTRANGVPSWVKSFCNCLLWENLRLKENPKIRFAAMPECKWPKWIPKCGLHFKHARFSAQMFLLSSSSLSLRPSCIACFTGRTQWADWRQDKDWLGSSSWRKWPPVSFPPSEHPRPISHSTTNLPWPPA